MEKVKVAQATTDAAKLQLREAPGATSLERHQAQTPAPKMVRRSRRGLRQWRR